MDHNTINLNNINFGNSFHEVDPEISNKLLPAVWHPTRWLNWQMLESTKKKIKEIEPFLTDEKQ